MNVMFYVFKEFSILKTKFLYYPEYMLGKKLNTCNLSVVFPFLLVQNESMHYRSINKLDSKKKESWHECGSSLMATPYRYLPI